MAPGDVPIAQMSISKDEGIDNVAFPPTLVLKALSIFENFAHICNFDLVSTCDLWRSGQYRDAQLS